MRFASFLQDIQANRDEIASRVEPQSKLDPQQRERDPDDVLDELRGLQAAAVRAVSQLDALLGELMELAALPEMDAVHALHVLRGELADSRCREAFLHGEMTRLKATHFQQVARLEAEQRRQRQAQVDAEKQVRKLEREYVALLESNQAAASARYPLEGLGDLVLASRGAQPRR